MAQKRTSIHLSLVRCGETAWAADGRLQGSSDLPLSPQGEASVSADALTLAGRRVTTFFHPPDEAAAETASIVAAVVGARTKAVVELAEANLGVFEGMTMQAFAERYPKRCKQWQEDPLSFTTPDGEDVASARARIFAGLGKVLRRARGDEFGVVLHQLGTGLLRCWLADRPPTEAWAMAAQRPRVERYLLAPETVRRLEDAGKVAYSHS
ncbi:MAG: histidine phosphatase family protein [Planctomycetota bacterium]